jgi:hypothetical protein
MLLHLLFSGIAVVVISVMNVRKQQEDICPLVLDVYQRLKQESPDNSVLTPSSGLQNNKYHVYRQAYLPLHDVAKRIGLH